MLEISKRVGIAMTVSKELQDIFRRARKGVDTWIAQTPRAGLAGVFPSPEIQWTRRELQSILDAGYRPTHARVWTAVKHD
jgi:hypothetical protein